MPSPAHSLQIKKLALTATLALIIGTSMPTTAKANPYDHGRDHKDVYIIDRHEYREWIEHEEWREHERWMHRCHRPLYAPRIAYIQPPVIYAPPPPTGINLIIPLDIR